MKWKMLTHLSQLDTIDRESIEQKVMIFKHSTRCSTSDMAKARVERTWNDENATLVSAYYLDLIAFRSISNAIEARYQIEHESPQVLVISNGRCIFSQTHMSISVLEIMQAVLAK